MKDIQSIEARMRPGRSSQAGFLNDTESLADCIEADNETLRRLGLTHAQLADRLETITQKARNKAIKATDDGKDYWDEVTVGVVVEDHFKVTWTSYMGYQNCPYGCSGREAKSDTDFTITNTKTGQSLFVSELLIHLIREHAFFEGHTSYRVDPEKCVEVLEIESGVDYAPRYVEKEYWVAGAGHIIGGCNTIEDYVGREFTESMKRCMAEGEKIDLGVEGSAAWLLDDSLYVIYVGVTVRKPESVVNGVPLMRVYNGAYEYRRATERWVED